jgi:hypothetical protein
MNIQTLRVKISGDTPLLMDRFPESARAEILAKQTGLAKGNKKLRNIQEEIRQSVHYLPDGTAGFPAAGFKNGMVRAVGLASDSIRTFNSNHVMGIQIINQVSGLIPIKFKKQDTMKHYIGNNEKVSPQFWEWSCELVIRFDANNISPSDIVNLINYAGFHVGLGAWRPKCRDRGSGSYGMYHATTS